jgi:hypothetical protein
MRIPAAQALSGSTSSVARAASGVLPPSAPGVFSGRAFPCNHGAQISIPPRQHLFRTAHSRPIDTSRIHTLSSKRLIFPPLPSAFAPQPFPFSSPLQLCSPRVYPRNRITRLREDLVVPICGCFGGRPLRGAGFDPAQAPALVGSDFKWRVVLPFGCKPDGATGNRRIRRLTAESKCSVIGPHP